MVFFCTICKQELFEVTKRLSCFYCGEQGEATWSCKNNHFQCEDCLTSDPEEITYRVCANSSETNPGKIANIIMKHQTFRDNGVEHHIVVAPAIITALINQKQTSVRRNRIKVAIKRTREIPYGVCGSQGACGASIGAGVTISLLTGASYKSTTERALALEASGKALVDLAERGGTRCCKESVYSAIESTFHFLEKKNITEGKLGNIQCLFQDLTGCQKESCTYYEKQ